MKILTGIATTTHVDKYNEQMGKSALDDMARQIREKYIPQLIEHDPNRQIGVILYGEVFQLADKEYALGIVSGIFENKEEAENFKTGESNNAWEDFRKDLDINKLLQLNNENCQQKNAKVTDSSKLNITDLLAIHLDSTQVLPDGTVYKIKRFIVSVGDLKIEVYPKDHAPQHFHVISKQRNIDARFDIKTLNLLNTKHGNMNEKDIKKIQNFFKLNPFYLKKLKSEYERMNDY